MQFKIEKSHNFQQQTFYNYWFSHLPFEQHIPLHFHPLLDKILSLGTAGRPFRLSINICCFGSVAFGLPTVVLCHKVTLRVSSARARSCPQALSANTTDRSGDKGRVTHPLCLTFCQEHTQHSFLGHRMAHSDYPIPPPPHPPTEFPRKMPLSPNPQSLCRLEIHSVYGSSGQVVIGWSCLQRNQNVFRALFPCLETQKTNVTQTDPPRRSAQPSKNKANSMFRTRITRESVPNTTFSL